MAAGELANNAGIRADLSGCIYTHICKEYFIGYPELSSLKDQSGVVLLDTRPSDAYAGQASWAKPGHIPGAINIPAQVLMDEKNVALIKSPDVLREIFVSQGVHRTKPSSVPAVPGGRRRSYFLS